MSRARARYENADPLTKLALKVLQRYDRRAREKARAETRRAPQATAEELRAASQAMERQKQFRNPIGPERSIYGRNARTLIDGQRAATVHSVAYTLGAEGKSGGGQLVLEKVNSSWERLIADAESRAGHELRIELDDPGMPNQEVLVLRDVEFQSLTGGYVITDIVEQTVFFTFESWELEEAVDERARLSEDHPILQTWEGAHA